MQAKEKPLYFARSVWLARRSVLVQSIGLAGFLTFLEGIRRIYEPAALIVGGGLVVLWTILKVRNSQ